MHTVDLWDNHLHDRGLANISAALRATSNNNLHSIYLGRNNITDSASLVAFAQVLQHTHVSEVDLGSNGIDGDTAVAFIAALQETSVAILHLRCNRIGNRLSQVGQSLQVTKIHTLDLSDNGIEGIEVLNLVQNLRDNTTLRILNLSYNHLVDTNAASFAEALQPTHINRLSLIHTGIDDHWVTTFAQHVEHNRTLSTVDLRISVKTIDFLRRKYSNITWGYFSNQV